MRVRRAGALVAGAGATLALAVGAGPAAAHAGATTARATVTAHTNAPFARAAARTGVPESLLKAMCWFEGRLSMHGGHPSADRAYGCMYVKDATLRLETKRLHLGLRTAETDLAANLLVGAAVLRRDALAVSPRHALPRTLAGWYGAVADYNRSPVRETALMQADAVYRVLHTGFTDRGVHLAAHRVRPDRASAGAIQDDTAALPPGCSIDPTAVGYPNAVDCIVENPNSYTPANRPYDYDINGIIIHETEEGPAVNAIKTFQDPSSGVSVTYLVGTDGTVYQMLPEQDIAYQDGNYWSNEHTIGIEHAGYDATGWQWFNRAEYLGSAKLAAYLLQKYNLPLDRAHVLAHGTVSAENVAEVPDMHVDPGPYWLWDYYFKLIHAQGVPYAPAASNPRIISISPSTDQAPAGPNGTETPANYGFLYLYNGPSTQSGLIPQLTPGDVTDETDDVEPRMSYYALAERPDAAGTGDRMYEIWYGELDQLGASPASDAEDGHLVWLAVPPGDTVTRGTGIPVTLVGAAGSQVPVYGDPISSGDYLLGSSPAGSVYDSGLTVVEDGTGRPWYVIDYNHRQAYVPASSVSAPAP